MIDSLKIILLTIFGSFLGIIAGRKLPSKVIDFLLNYDILPFILIFAMGILSLDNENIDRRHIIVLFVISLILAVIMYFAYDYLNSNSENMTSLKLQKSLNKLPWFTPERPKYLQLN